MSHLFLVSPTPGAQNLTLYDEFLDTFLASKSPATRKAYEKDINLYAVFCGLPVAEAVANLLSASTARANLNVAAFKNRMLDNNLSSATINRRLSCLKALTTTAREYGITDLEITVKHEPTRPRRDARGPELDTVRLAMRRLEADCSGRGMMSFALCRLLLDCALRRQEAASLKLEDLDLAGGALVVVGKGCRREVINLPSPTIRALQAWLAVRGEEPGPLFPGRDRMKSISGSTVYRIVRENFGNRPHGLRHLAISIATRAAAREGLALHDVQRFSRHRDPQSLFCYLDDSREAQARLSTIVAESSR